MDFINYISDSLSFLKTYYPLYISGAIATILVSLFTVLIGTAIGVVVALMKLSRFKIVRFISSIYVEITRGTPVIVQVFIWYNAFSYIIDIPDIYIGGMELSRLLPGALALSLNSGAYVAEIIRAGILSIDKGQKEASLCLGMKTPTLMRFIIIPQAIKNILPAIGNEFIVLIKESSILYVIGIQELMAKTSTIQSSTFQPIAPLVVASALYLALTFSLSKFIGMFERRLNRDDRN